MSIILLEVCFEREVTMSIRKKGNRFELSYRIPGQKKPCFERFLTEAEAKFRESQINLWRSQGELTLEKASDKMTVSELLDIYVRDYGTVKWGDSYYSMSIHRIEHYIKPYIGNLPIDTLSVHQLEKYYTSLLSCPAVVTAGKKDEGKCVSISVIEKCHALIRSALNQAVRWGFIETNVAELAMTPKKQKNTRSVWSRKEALKALDACTNPTLKLLIKLSLACSLRIGEELGLQWCDVHFSDVKNESYIDVRQELKRCDKKALKDTKSEELGRIFLKFPNLREDAKSLLVLKLLKTESSKRNVLIAESVANELRELKKAQQAQKDELGALYQDYDLVFAQSNGRPFEAHTVETWLAELCKSSGVTPVVFHSLRHLSVSIKLELTHGDIKSVQSDTGHSQANMVTDVYAHTFNENRKKNAQLMDDYFFCQKESPVPQPDPSAPQLTPGMVEALQNNPYLFGLVQSMAEANNKNSSPIGS